MGYIITSVVWVILLRYTLPCDGQAVCNQGTFGANCVGTCHCQSSQCDSFTGTCTGTPTGCSAGWEGNNCQDACDQGSFGPDCAGTCHCQSSQCDRFTGMCTGTPTGCSYGWEGSNCQDECQAPEFGLSCISVCHCPNGNCNYESGCTGNCYPEWAPLQTAMCQIGLVDSEYTRKNPGVTVPVHCTMNRDEDGNEEKLNLGLSRKETSLDDSSITIGYTTDNSTARTTEFMVDNVSDGDNIFCQLRKDNDRQAVLAVNIDLYDLPVLQATPIQGLVEDSSVTISWSAWNETTDQGDPPVIGYIPYYKQWSGEEEWTAGSSDAVEDLIFTFRDLTPETSYSFSVAAVREGGGEGNTSLELNVKTICAAPVSGPTDVQAHVSGERQENVEISWKNPSVEDIRCGSGVFKYTIYYSSNNLLLRAAPESQEIISSDATLYIVEGLAVGETYTFQISLTTEGGESSLSDGVNHLLPLLPSLRNTPKVNDSASCGDEVTITWNEWTEGEDEGTPPIIGYIPYHKLATDVEWIASDPVDHDRDNITMAFMFKDLSVSTFYNFTISVVREEFGGEGDMGETICYETTACKPGPPLGTILGSIFAGLLLILLSLLAIFLIRRRRSQNERSTGEHANMNEVKDWKGQPASDYENAGSNVCVAGVENRFKQHNHPTVGSNSAYEVPFIDLQRKGVVASSDNKRDRSTAETTIQSSPTLAYENTVNNGSSPRHPMKVSTFSDFMRSSTAIERVLSDFKTLDLLVSRQHMETATGALPDNLNKNRFPGIIPVDKYRTQLKSVSLAAGNDYINACFVNIGNPHHNIIMTQSPLPETVEDFWRLVFDYKCQTIIMLNSENSKDQTIVKYWPDLDDAQFGAMTISSSLIEKKATYTIHHFKVSHQSFRDSFHVKHFAFYNWPTKDGKLSALASFICEIGFGKASSNPTLLQCIDGAGRCGIYAAVAAEINRIQKSQNIKLFDTLQNVRNQNPFAVNTQEDYIMCHRLLQFYITEMVAYDVIA